MNPTLNDPHDTLGRSLSRADHQRPPLKRTHASRNLFPDLPPIQPICMPPSDADAIELTEDVTSTIRSGSFALGGNPVKADLSPMCPPSPPSPISSSSESSTSSLATPLEADDWERSHDGFAPPLNSTQPPVHSWPPTPNPNIPPRVSPQACDSYHGWSGNSLFERKRFWYRRHRLWWDYDEHCRHLHNYLASGSTSEGNLDATMYYPPSPALLPSRLTPWSGPNGVSFNTERVATDALGLPRVPRLQVHPPWVPVFPRFGDIEDLRDPSCELLDRMFMNFPPYAISKLLFVEQMVAQEHDARAGQRTFERSPSSPSSPPASFDTPWSPGSVYSDDGHGFAEISTMATSSMMSLPSRASGLFGELRWVDRWELLRRRLFPQSVSPSSTASTTSPLLSAAESDPALSSPPVHLPPRPGTPLPDHDEQDRAVLLAHAAHAHSGGQTRESTVRDGSVRGLADSVDPDARPSPPGIHGPICDASPSDADNSPVVRLPSSSSHPPRTYAAARVAADLQDVCSPSPAGRSLADELSAALGGGEAGVQFSVAPPEAVVEMSARFSFFAEEGEFEGEFEYEDGASGFDVGASAGVVRVHVEAVPG